MAVPDFQSLMLPLLEQIAGGAEYSAAEIRPFIAERLQLTADDLQQKMASGTQTFANRLAWAKIHLERAGLLEKTRRGWFRITRIGEDVLRDPPPRVDLHYLNRFPGSLEFRNRSVSNSVEPDENGGAATPEETLDAAYQQLRRALAQELLGQVLSSSSGFFERLVVDLMMKMGYGGVNEEAGVVTPLTGDEGIDGIINEDHLGLDVIYLQAKRWERPVGRPEIQKFVGALHGKRARKGVFICTSSFTEEARDYVRAIDPKVVLIDGVTLAGLMIDFNLGVSRRQVYELKQIDSDYFNEE